MTVTISVLEFEHAAVMAFRSSVRQSIIDQINASRQLLRKLKALQQPSTRPTLRRIEHRICLLRRRLRIINAAPFEVWRAIGTKEIRSRWVRLNQASTAELTECLSSIEVAILSDTQAAKALAGEVIKRRISRAA